MSMVNGGLHQQQTCQFENEQMTELINATKDNGHKIDSLNKSIDVISGQHKDIIKWLLVVVCTIALGKSVLDVAKSVFKSDLISNAGASE